MFGFSFPKIIFLLIILFIIWNIFKFIEKKTKPEAKGNKKNTTEGKEEALTECIKCGSFFSKELKNKCPLCKEANEKYKK